MADRPAGGSTPIAEVRRIARLAGLELDEAGIERIGRELGSILESMSSLDEAGAATHDHGSVSGAPSLPLREDAVEPCLGAEAALGNAPDPARGLFRVPRSLDE